MSNWAVDTVFLSATNFLTGTIGFFYRLFLSKTLGSEGMGIYQQTMAFFSTAITVITAGIPISISKLVAETHKKNPINDGNIVASALLLTSVFSLFGVIFLISLSEILYLRVLLIVLPAAIFVGFSTVIKGYFFGIQHSTPVRWSNLSESIFRSVLGIIIIKSCILSGFEGKTRGAVTALVIGELVQFIVLLLFFIKSMDRSIIPNKSITFINIKKILVIAIPISLSQIIHSASVSVEALLIPKGLTISGFSPQEALSLYGKTTGMVFPLLFFPALFIRALSSNIIPQISQAVGLNRTQYAFKLSEQALLLSSFYSFAVTGFLLSLSKPIAELLFSGFNLGNLIMGFSAIIPFFYTESVLIAILRGMGNNITPIITSLISFFITNGMLYLLTVNTSLGMFGYAIALITASAVTIYIILYNLEKRFKKRFNMVSIILRPLICCLFMIFILSKTYMPLKVLGLPNIICIATDFLLGFSGYLILALALGLKLKPYKY